jgi:hypothetical protein
MPTTTTRRSSPVPGDINDNTIDGMLAFCDYLTERGYAATTQVEPWKIAARKVFSIVEGNEEYGSIKLADVDVDDYVRRFEVKARGQYKHGSLMAYVRRLRNAIEAYAYFLAHGRPPTFRQASKRSKAAESSQTVEPAQANAADVVAAMQEAARDPATPEDSSSPPGLLDYVFPLRSGQVAKLRLPLRLDKDDAERLVLFLRALQYEPQGQIPEHTGEAA